ncbi:MAG: rhodanese-like domain-containing protein [Pseudomonadota bacterium]
MKKTFMKLSKAVLISSILLASSAVIADEKNYKETDIQQIAINLANQTILGGYKLMSVDQLKTLIDNKDDFVLIDAHPKREFIDGYIDGATNFGFQSKRSGVWDKDIDIEGGSTQEQFRKLLGDNLNKKIVIYCGFTKCGRSHNASWWARFMGYTNVYRAPGGITGWKDAGYPYKTVK